MSSSNETDLSNAHARRTLRAITEHLETHAMSRQDPLHTPAAGRPAFADAADLRDRLVMAAIPGLIQARGGLNRFSEVPMEEQADAVVTAALLLADRYLDRTGRMGDALAATAPCCPRCGSTALRTNVSGDMLMCTACRREWPVKPPAAAARAYAGPIDLAEPAPDDATPNPPEHGAPVG